MPRNLEVTTPSEKKIRVTRTFDAPPSVVFECHTKPELITKWLLGPPGWSMPVCEIDPRGGGTYRYVWRNDESGREFGVHGVFEEVRPPERMVHVETMDGVPGKTSCVATFAESNGGTLFTLTLEFDSKELRDAALESGMTGGMGMSYDRLDDVSAEARSRT